jgi:hypothetical protein
MKDSEIKFEILEDGTVTIDTDDLSGPNHVSADQLLKDLAEMLGGAVTVKHKDKLHVHSHRHAHHEHYHEH